jgi:hypothetical protein
MAIAIGVLLLVAALITAALTRSPIADIAAAVLFIGVLVLRYEGLS